MTLKFGGHYKQPETPSHKPVQQRKLQPPQQHVEGASFDPLYFSSFTSACNKTQDKDKSISKISDVQSKDSVYNAQLVSPNEKTEIFYNKRSTIGLYI